MWSWLHRDCHDQCAELKKDKAKLETEVHSLKKLIDELMTRDHESKAVYNCMATDYENKIAALEGTVEDLKDQVHELKTATRKQKSKSNE